MAQLGTKTNPAGVLAERSAGDGNPALASAAFAERHFTVAQVAALWGLSEDTVRRVFCDEPRALHSSPRLYLPQSAIRRSQ